MQTWLVQAHAVLSASTGDVDNEISDDTQNGLVLAARISPASRSAPPRRLPARHAENLADRTSLASTTLHALPPCQLYLCDREEAGRQSLYGSILDLLPFFNRPAKVR